MASRIKADVLQALDDWKAGKPVKSIELGHVHRMQDHGQFSPTIDFSVRLWNDQERAHAYCFAIIAWFAQEGTAFPDSHEHFQKICDVLEGKFREDKGNDLTAEELDGAESLAWKALHVGWARAISGHAEGVYIEVSHPQPQVQAT